MITIKDKIKLRTAKDTEQYINRLLGIEIKYRRKISIDEI